ncbi:MAG: right-handed parallel beta-helix repeat-containing protein [Phycisphaerales bacterium]|nr:right-handed parallel beta-helix repeat-containing protein [Phycisphaerales bacterium]
MRSFVCLMMFCVCVSSASGDILRVPDQYGTIQSAIDAAVDGDTVLVSPGHYFEQIVYTKNIDLRSTDGPTTTIIEGPLGAKALVTHAEDTVVDGFTITGAFRLDLMDANQQLSGGFESTTGGGSVTGVVLRNCLILRCTGQGGVVIRGRGGLIENCTFDKNIALLGGGVFFSSSENAESVLVVRNTIFYSNWGRFGGGAIHGRYGQFGPENKRILVESCTFYRNRSLLFGTSTIQTEVGNSILIEVYNSILYENSRVGFSNPLDMQDGPIENIVIEYSYVGTGYPGEGNLSWLDNFPSPSGSPRINTGYSSENFLGLDPHSPLVDAGNNSRVSVDYALSGLPRFADVNTDVGGQPWGIDTGVSTDGRPIVDMGAYEYQTDCNENLFSDTPETRGPFAGSGSALKFDGIDDYARVAMIQPMIDRESTVEFWQYTNDFRNQSSFGIVDCDGPGEERIQAHVPWGDGTVYFDHGDFNVQSFARITNTSDYGYTELLGLWIHWAFVIDPDTNTTTIYRNGIAIQQNSAWGTFNGDANTPLIIGGFGDPLLGCELLPFRGVIDEFRIWEVARDGAQIRSLMNTELIGSEGGLIAYYPFSEGEGTASANMCLNQVQDSAVLMNGVSWYSAADSDTNGNWIPDDCDPDCAADLNGDGGLNFFDVPPS